MQYILYDSNCAFCCNIVKRLSSLLEESKVLFLPFNSAKGKQITSDYNLEEINSVIYINHKQNVFIKSKAILNICKLMRFPYKLLYIFNIFPKSFLNLAYNFIAKNRMYI